MARQYLFEDGTENNGPKYTIILGPNTKQWWIYDEENDLYIDPPKKILDETKAHSSDIKEQEEFLRNIIDSNPSWLYDTDYFYDDIEV